MIWSVSIFSIGNGTKRLCMMLIFSIVDGCLSILLSKILIRQVSLILSHRYHTCNAAAAAVSGLASNVLAPAPCLPSKFRLVVDIQYSPAGILSSFIPRHALQPGWRISNPASSNILSSLLLYLFATCCDPERSSLLHSDFSFSFY